MVRCILFINRNLNLNYWIIIYNTYCNYFKTIVRFVIQLLDKLNICKIFYIHINL